jgi:hypothetical protein
MKLSLSIPLNNESYKDKPRSLPLGATKIDSSDPPLTPVRPAYPAQPLLTLSDPPIQLASFRPGGRLHLDRRIDFSAICFGDKLRSPEAFHSLRGFRFRTPRGHRHARERRTTLPRIAWLPPWRKIGKTACRDEGQGDIGELDEGSTFLKMNLHYPQLADWDALLSKSRVRFHTRRV